MNNRYEQITKLIQEEIDETIKLMIDEDGLEFESEEHREEHRNDLIESYLNFLKKNLQSDNA